jgi:hypothetical protein
VNHSQQSLRLDSSVSAGAGTTLIRLILHPIAADCPRFIVVNWRNIAIALIEGSQT